MLPFQFASGSVLGKEHRRKGKNAQDALVLDVFPEHAVAIVCDGCGSGSRSEVGAVLGSRVIAHAISERFRRSHGLNEESLERVRLDVLAHLRVMVNAMGGSFSQTVEEHFLFTVVGMVMTAEQVIIFSIGDGVYAINEQVTTIGPFEGNKPPYLGYGLTASPKDTASLRFVINAVVPTEEVSSLLIGTDGVGDLLAASGKPIVGTKTVVEEISALCGTDAFFGNPDALNRRLRLINRELVHPEWLERRLSTTYGLLDDDTTLIVARRKEISS
jgi:hypothetical protein